jgi:hypothetical protein
MTLPLSAMNQVTPVDQAAEQAYTTFFRRDESTHTSLIKPYIAQVMDEVRKSSPPHDDDSIVDKLERGQLNLRSEKDSEQLTNIIIRAMDKSFEHQRLEDDKKISKKVSAYIAAAATLISAGVTLTIFLVSHK